MALNYRATDLLRLLIRPQRARLRLGLFALSAGLLIATVALLLQPSHNNDIPSSAVAGLRVGQVAPDFQLRDSGGVAYRLAALRGRPVLLNFWSSTCEPCRAEMPALEHVYRATGSGHGAAKGRSPLIIGINAGGDDMARVKQFAHTTGVNYPLLLDPYLTVSVVRYHVYALPLTIALDAHGRIHALHLGALSYADGIRLLAGI